MTGSTPPPGTCKSLFLHLWLNLRFGLHRASLFPIIRNVRNEFPICEKKVVLIPGFNERRRKSKKVRRIFDFCVRTCRNDEAMFHACYFYNFVKRQNCRNRSLILGKVSRSRLSLIKNRNRRSSVGWCATFGAGGSRFHPRWLQRVCFDFLLICVALALNTRKTEHWQRKGAKSAPRATSLSVTYCYVLPSLKGRFTFFNILTCKRSIFSRNLLWSINKKESFLITASHPNLSMCNMPRNCIDAHNCLSANRQR